MIKIFVNSKKKLTKGLSVIEIVISLGILGLIMAALVSLSLGGLEVAHRGEQLFIANNLAQEALEAVRSIRDQDWSSLSYSHCGLKIVNGHWELNSEGSSEDIDGYIRQLIFSPVYRNSNNEIISSSTPGALRDVFSLQVAVNVSWKLKSGKNQTITRTTYLTNWR